MSLAPSLRGLVDSYRAGLNKSEAEAFRAGFIGYLCRVHTAIYGITFRFSEGAALDDGYGSTKGGDIVDSPLHPKVVQLRLVFPFRPLMVKCFLVFCHIHCSSKTYCSLWFA